MDPEDEDNLQRALPVPSANGPKTLDVVVLGLNGPVPEALQPVFREKLMETIRREKRLAAEAGNAANTSQLVGGTFGAAITGGGIIAWATSAGPVNPSVVVITLFGAFVMGVGFLLGHWMNKKKIAHEENVDKYLERAEVMK